MFKLIAKVLPVPSMVTRNSFWYGLYIAQKKKATTMWTMMTAVLGLLDLGFPIAARVRAALPAITAFVRLLGKAFFLKTFDDAVRALIAFRKLYPDVREVMLSMMKPNETLIVVCPLVLFYCDEWNVHHRRFATCLR